MEDSKSLLLLKTIIDDDVRALKELCEDTPELKGYKLGNLPLASVAVLFGSTKTTEYLLGFYRDTNVFSEHDAPEELKEKQKEIITDAVFSGARFIEPAEIAYLIADEKTSEAILKKAGLKTVSARNRYEKILEEKGVHSLTTKGNNEFALRTKDGKRNVKIRAFVILAAVAFVLAIIVPVTVLACLRVKVSYYDGAILYGEESGLRGKDITISDPEKTGYTFLGWFTDKDLTVSANGKLPNKSGNYYAGWQINEYTVIFDVGDYVFENDFENVNTAKYGTKLIMPVPKLTGKLFVGWFDESGNMVTDNVYTQNITLKPRFVDFENNSIDNPYEITSQEQTLFLSEQEGYFVFKDGLVFDEKYISSGAFTSYSKGFSGVLVGDNRTIFVDKASNPIFLTIGENGTVKDLTIVVRDNITLNDYNYDRYGVLVGLNSGRIENVRVSFSRKFEGIATFAAIQSKIAIGSVGGIAGSNAGIIENSVIDGKLQSGILSTYPTVNYTGGIAGSNSGKIVSCSSEAEIEANIWNGGIGGIVGYNIGVTQSSRNFSHIVVKGVTTATTTDIIDSLVCQAGGIVSSNMVSRRNSELSVGKIIDCSNFGTVEYSTAIMTGYLGGIAGYSQGEIERSESGVGSSVVLKETEYLCYLGGIVGFAARRSEGKISICVNRATVSGGDKGYAYVGGIAGESISENADDKLVISFSDNYGTVSGGCYMGGIVGNAVSTEISKCIFAGKVEGFSREKYTLILGGIAGGAVQSDVSSSISKGSIESKSGDFSTYNYVGGLVGECIDSRVFSSVFVGSLSTKDNDTLGLLFSLINLLNKNSSISDSYAISDGVTYAYNDYDGSVDNDGKLVYHDENDINKPLIHPSNDGLVEKIEDLNNKNLSGISVSDGEVVRE